MRNDTIKAENERMHKRLVESGKKSFIAQLRQQNNSMQIQSITAEQRGESEQDRLRRLVSSYHEAPSSMRQQQPHTRRVSDAGSVSFSLRHAEAGAPIQP